MNMEIMYVAVIFMLICIPLLVWATASLQKRVTDLEKEATYMKRDYRKEIRHVNTKVNFVMNCKDCKFRPWCDEKRECASHDTPETQQNEV